MANTKHGQRNGQRWLGKIWENTFDHGGTEKIEIHWRRSNERRLYCKRRGIAVNVMEKKLRAYCKRIDYCTCHSWALSQQKIVRYIQDSLARQVLCIVGRYMKRIEKGE